MAKAALSSTAPGRLPPLEAAVEWLDANTATQTKNWLDANIAIQTKKTGWMPTQQYKQKNWLDANIATQTKKNWLDANTAIQTKKLVGCQHSNTIDTILPTPGLET